MLITDSKERRKSNPFYAGRGQGGWPDYAAVIVAKDDDTDRFIRRMEDPAHENITLLRLPEGEQKQAENDLMNVNSQIKDIIDNAIRNKDEEGIQNLIELAELFPDLDASAEGNRQLKTRLIESKRSQPPINGVSDSSDLVDDLLGGLTDEAGDQGTEGEGEGNSNNGRVKGRKGKGDKRRQSPPRKNRKIREYLICRTKPDHLAVLLVPSRTAERTASFSLHPSGEDQIKERRVSIVSLGRVEPADIQVDISHGVVTAKIPESHSGHYLIHLLIDRTTPYTGYLLHERVETLD